ncbi:glycoside hydrolase family 20 zincin-like fold domain-containing protein [Actinoplanes sp. NPDC020271]|uniref:glycoside hydrolase family 20 zincin-like fold domain-containing protein n=1 Tax=Actinoplanes sp. NPDC020271 TaxID=3363896 RepID=UPI0037B61D72
MQTRRLFRLVVAAAVVLAATTGSAAHRPPPEMTPGSVIPAPAEVVPSHAEPFRLTVITASGAAVPVADQVAAALRPATGFLLPVQLSGAGAVDLRINEVADPWLGDEGYRLEIRTEGVALRANEAAGLFAGFQTLRQLLPRPSRRARYVMRTGPSRPA